MRKAHVVLMIPVLGAVLSAVTAHSQSFNCKLAQSPREHAVCSDTNLAKLDSEVAASYKSLRAQLSPPSAAAVQSDQRAWLHWLDLVCPANGKGLMKDMNSCLRDEYTARKAALQSLHAGAILLYTRAQFAYVQAKPGEASDADNDPGFGYGSLEWPQIDRPSAAQATWNTAMRDKAETLGGVTGSSNRKASFQDAIDGTGFVDISSSVVALNERLIVVSLTDSTYSWGAVHPLTGSASFSWWLDHGRELRPADLFLPNSGWQQKLVPLTIARLDAQSDLQSMLWTGDELHKGVEAGVADPSDWSVSREGLTVTFGPYTVAPYVEGMPQVRFTWDDLKPFLQPSLQPATLPATLPGIKPNAVY